jgi:AraC-like DNA-binding protein
MSSRLDRTRDWEQKAAQSGYSVEKMAKSCKVSRRQLLRFFVEHFKKTPKHWMDEVRARAAEAELLRGELVKTASTDVCFKHQSNFTRFIKRVKGTTPRDVPKKSTDVPNR